MDQRASGTASSMVGVPFTGTLGGGSGMILVSYNPLFC